MARVYFMNLLFNLNLRTSGHIMRESPSNNRNRRLSITGTGTSTCTGSTNVPLSDIRSYQGNNRFQHNIVHISQSTDTKEDKVSTIHVRSRDAVIRESVLTLSPSGEQVFEACNWPRCSRLVGALKATEIKQGQPFGNEPLAIDDLA